MTELEVSDLLERVRISERQYVELLEASNDAIYVLVQDEFRYVNPRFAELFGYSKAEISAQGFDYKRLIHRDSQPLVAARSRAAREHQPLPSRYEFRALRKNGSFLEVEVSVSYIRFDGQPAVLGILQDITARKAYERTLLRKNHELSVLNAVADAITQVRDLPAILDGVVERLIELLSVDAAGISITDDRGERFASVHYRGASETFVREMQRRDPRSGVLGRALQSGELQVVNQLDHDARVEHGAAVREGFKSAVSLPLGPPDRPSGVVTVFTRQARTFLPDDLHLFVAVARQIAIAIENARLYKKAREGIARLKALSEIARGIGSTLQVEGVFRIVGDRLQALVPYRRIALYTLRPNNDSFSVLTIDRSAPGEPPAVRRHPPKRKTPTSPLTQALDSQQTLVIAPGSFVSRHSASPDPECLSAVVPVIADLSAVGVFVVSIDDAQGLRERDLELLRDLAAHMAISLKNARVFQDLDRAYRELKETKDQLVRAEKLHGLGEMAAGVAHDFNNVLSAILGRAQMLKLMLRDEEILRSVKVIETAALDGANTVRRIQEFAKAQSDVAFVAVNLNSMVGDAIELATTRIHELNVNVEVQVVLGEVALVEGNPSELREVLTNLIYNAIDAMPHGGRLTVRTGTDSEARAWLEVEDTGIGMDEDTKKKIFDPFFTTKGTRGTGLGMSVSYAIVQRHRGEFQIRSESGKGSALRVVLPVARAALTEDLLPFEDTPSELPTPLPLAPGPRAKVLVIDDDVAVRDVLADILRSGDHDVVAAADGVEGMALFRNADFDVVFTDLGMPGMSGWDVARQVKAVSPATPVGLITGWGATIENHELAAHQVDLIITKPFRFHQVLSMVAEAMELRTRPAPRSA